MAARAKGAKTRPIVHTNEDQRANARSKQARQCHQAQRRTTDPCNFHDQKAPSTGEPSSVLTAAKLPAEAMIVRAIGGAFFWQGSRQGLQDHRRSQSAVLQGRGQRPG